MIRSCGQRSYLPNGDTLRPIALNLQVVNERDYMTRQNNALYKKIYQEILQAIQSEELRPGDSIGTESEIAARFDVSRITSKRALDELAKEGYIVRQPGRGNYVQDDLAEESTSKDVGLIAIIMPELSPSYGVRLLASLHEGLRQSGFDVLLGLSHGDQQCESEEIQRLRIRGAQGFIVFPVNGEYHNAQILRLHIDGMPLVLVDKPLSRIPVSAVWSENEQAGWNATRFLLDTGHCTVAFLSPPTANTETLEQRYAGYERALREAGITVEPDLILCDLHSEGMNEESARAEQRYQRVLRFFQRHPALSGVLAAEYRIGLVALKALRKLNMACPDSVSVITFDAPWLNDSVQELTHVRQDEWAMGQAAVRLLVQQMRDPSTRAELIAIPTSLIQGFSTSRIVPQVSSDREANIGKQ